MKNLAVIIIGYILVLIAYVSSLTNSYLIMQLIGATTLKWVLWVVAIVFAIVGMILVAVGSE